MWGKKMAWKTNKRTGGKFNTTRKKKVKTFKSYKSLKKHKSRGNYDFYKDA